MQLNHALRLLRWTFAALVASSVGCVPGNVAATGSDGGSPDAASFADAGNAGLTGLARPQLLAVDSASIYVTTLEDSFDVPHVPATVLKIPRDGGPSTVLVDAHATAIALDASNVFFASVPTVAGAPNITAIMKVAIAGGSPAKLADVPGVVGAMAVDASNVYFTTNTIDMSSDAAFVSLGAIAKVPLDGGPVATLASGKFYPSALTIDAANLYWLANDDTNGLVMTAPIAGGAIKTLASIPYNPQGPTSAAGAGTIAVDADSVYSADRGDNGGVDCVPTDGAIRKVPLGGGAFITLAADQPAPIGIALDSSSVFWVSVGSFCNTSRPVGTVQRMAKSGGAAADVAMGLDGPSAVAIAGASVFWIVACTGTSPVGAQTSACRAGMGGAVQSASK